MTLKSLRQRAEALRMFYNNEETLLNGQKIEKIEIGEEYLRFTTPGKQVAFVVSGDCCSHSYFQDFIGVEKLLEADHVISLSSISIDDPPGNGGGWDNDCLQAYGFRIVSEHPKWGEVTSVFSFRNASNGYYGGMIDAVDPQHVRDVREITKDWVSD